MQGCSLKSPGRKTLRSKNPTSGQNVPQPGDKLTRYLLLNSFKRPINTDERFECEGK